MALMLFMFAFYFIVILYYICMFRLICFHGYGFVNCCFGFIVIYST